MHLKSVWYSANPAPNSPDTIHQTLMFGRLDEIKSLKKTIGEVTLRKLFINNPKKIYNRAALNFIKKFILKVNTPIDEQQYLKTTPRTIR